MNGRRSNVHAGPFQELLCWPLPTTTYLHKCTLYCCSWEEREELKCYTNCSPTAIQSAVTATARRRRLLAQQQHSRDRETLDAGWWWWCPPRHGGRAQNNNDTEIAKQLPKTDHQIAVHLLLGSSSSIGRCGCCFWSLDRLVCNRNTPLPKLHRCRPFVYAYGRTGLSWSGNKWEGKK